MKTPILQLKNLAKIYKGKEGPVKALNDLSLTVQGGEIFGLLGPNGAGKTTAVKLIMGLMAPSQGRIIFNNQSLAMTDSRKLFGFLPENFQPNPHLTVGEYIQFQQDMACSAQSQAGNTVKAEAENLLKLVGMKKFSQRRISDLSKGMGQRLGLAQAFAGTPEFLLLDEPTSGLDPIGRGEVIDILLSLKQEGKTILFCSHILSEVERLCDRIGILVEGKLQFSGSVPDFLNKLQAANLDEAFRKEVKWAQSC